MPPKLPPLDARIPAWNMDDLLPRGCPVCESETGQVRFIRPDGLHVAECGQCRAHFISPAPSESQLARFYATYDETHRRDAALTAPELLATYRSLGPLSDFRLRELGSIMQFPGRRALDVGFGRAHFLWCLQQLGAEVHGIELDDAALRIARDLGIAGVRKAMIGDCLGDKPYDLIVLNDLIEHPLEPMKLLRMCASLLAPGGLMLIWTPNGAAARNDTNPTTFRVDLEHMQYLAPETCAFIAGNLGLPIAHLETCGLPNLKGIDRPRAASSGLASAAKRLLKTIPGMATLRRLRPAQDERLGQYHLFCILQKPDQ